MARAEVVKVAEVVRGLGGMRREGGYNGEDREEKEWEKEEKKKNMKGHQAEEDRQADKADEETKSYDQTTIINQRPFQLPHIPFKESIPSNSPQPPLSFKEHWGSLQQFINDVGKQYQEEKKKMLSISHLPVLRIPQVTASPKSISPDFHFKSSDLFLDETPTGFLCMNNFLPLSPTELWLDV
ncbi:hypothetical protein ACEPPN_012231 [Leptodophora sp. 'Broadleaf-Isolate-01']